MPITSITRASTTGTGAQGNSDSVELSLSADGRFVAFRSVASNLVPGDTNGAGDVFVKDLATGVITRVNTAANGTQGNDSNYFTGSPAISADGRFVAFQSGATNLVPGDTNGHADIFVKDLTTGAIIRASTAADGTQARGDGGWVPALSADGRFVAFYSWASNLTAGDTNGASDIFVKDLTTGAIARASTAADGTQGNNDSRFFSPLSADGRFVAFESLASNLVPGDTNGTWDIFVKDLATGAITLASTAADGTPANAHSIDPTLSADGRIVAFRSPASNLVPGDTNGTDDVFVKDLTTGAVTLASTAADGAQGNYSYNPSLSADGRFVAFQSYASGLVPGDTNGSYDVFVKDLATGAIERISTDALGAQGNGASWNPVFSPSGTKVAFSSLASNLVPGDTNGAEDIFVVTLGTAPTSLFPGTPGDDNYCRANGGDQAPGFVNDSMTGLAGNDCFAPKGGKDTVVGGPGIDLLDYSDYSPVFGAPPAGAVINLASGVSIDPWGNSDITRQIENAIGTPFADQLVGTEGANQLTGLAGNDTAKGLGGPDTINLGDGNDQGDGNAGNDTMTGGSGNDSLYGMEGADSLAGEGDNDLVVGGGGKDTLGGGAGNDTLSGDTGDDVIDAGVGSDVADGGPGNDRIDLVGLAPFVLPSYTGLPDGDDTGLGGDGDDTITGGGGDLLMGQGGNDVLLGGHAAPGSGGLRTLIGGDGNDVLLNGWDFNRPDSVSYGSVNLFGEAGNDTLIGGYHNDVIDGGSGADRLSGMGDSDTFVLSAFLSGTSARAPDVITDFQGAGTSGGWDQDYLRLQTQSGNLAAASFTHLGSGLWQFTDGAFTTFVQILAAGGVPVTALLGPGYADTSDFGIF